MVNIARMPAAPHRRDAILEAVAFAAERLLASSDWREAVPEVLERLGWAADVSRAYVIQAAGTPQANRIRQTAEWCGPGIPTQRDNRVLTGPTWGEAGFARWERSMLAGEAIVGAVSSFPDDERRELQGQDIRSLAAIPIFVGSAWWGCIGFDDCLTERDWREELDALRASAGVLGAAIHRQRADEDLRERELRYQALVERIPGVTYTDVPTPGRELGAEMGFISPQIESMLGHPVDRFLEDPGFWFSVIHPDDLQRLQASNAFDANDTSPFDQEYRMRRADGRYIWVHDTSTAVFGADGDVDHFLGFMTDITGRKEAEQRYRALVEHIPAVVYAEALEASADTVYLSPQVEQLLGYTLQEWRSAPHFWFDHIHPEDVERVRAENERANRTGEPFVTDYRFLASDGEYRWLRDEAVRVVDDAGAPLFWQGVFLDITQQKRAEGSLREAEARLRALIEHIPAVVYTEDVGGDPEKFYISPQVEDVFGYTPDEWRWTQDFWADHIHPDDREHVLEIDGETNQTLEPYTHEYRLRHRDGHWVWIHDEASFVPGPGDGGFWQGFMLDITERREAEEQLREAELKFRTIVEQNQAIFYTQDIDPDDPAISRTTYIAPGNTEMLGYTLDEITADPTLWRTIVHPDDRDRVFAADAESNVAGHGRFSMEYRMIAKDGRIVWVQDEAALVSLPGKTTYWQGFLLDVTERKEAEVQLERALDVEREATQRLRAVDEMKNTFLQAVSHDLRTPLAAILGLAITLERGDLHLDEADSRDLARRIAQNARRLERLVTNLLDMDRLARGIVAPKLEEVDVAALVGRVLDESQLVPAERMHTDLRTAVQAIDAAKVERIVENLLANTARHVPRDAWIWVSVRPEVGGLTIAVEDDGPGIPAELRESVFEPFRQGGDASRHSPGVGVGLTLVRRFAQLHGGRAWVQDRDGGGASFRVFLPAAASPGLIPPDDVLT
jgi:PAS domain S-box-containing protein